MKECRVTIGVVDFLNTRPLIFDLEREETGRNMTPQEKSFLTFIHGSPSQCSNLLKKRKVDIAILPSIEYAQCEQYRILPDISISSRREAGSVLLFSRKDIRDIRSIALDESSRTSSALLKILCFEKFKITPQFIPRQLQPAIIPEEQDAALLIGDKALFAPRSMKELLVSDLGRDWSEMTSLPFVFAFWAGYPDIPPSCLKQLKRSKNLGIQRYREISERYIFQKRTHPDISYAYLRHNMNYSFGKEEKEGLDLFYDLCLKYRLINRKRPLKFYEC